MYTQFRHYSTMPATSAISSTTPVEAVLQSDIGVVKLAKLSVFYKENVENVMICCIRLENNVALFF